MVGILCGPVIGHVTSTSAVVLLEIDSTIDVQGILEDSDSGNKLSVEKRLDARKPGVFKFENLRPSTKYKFHASGVSDGVLGQFATFPDDITKVNIAFVSCDRPAFNVNVSMWDQLKEKISKESIHLVLHIGDNVYIDEHMEDLKNEEIVNSDELFNPDKIDQTIPYVKARTLLRNLPKSEWASKTEEILEIYRNKYREVWTLSNRAYVLSHTSNLMILDDHEVRDDIGEVKPDDYDPESREFFLATLAIQVYHEYQRQLWDVNGAEFGRKLLNEFYVIQLGGIGIMMLDSRTTKSINKPLRAPGDESYYGREQMDEIHRHLRNTENNIRLWLVISTLPLMFLRRAVNKLGGVIAEDDLEAFINVHHEKDLVPILEDIRSFKKSTSAAGIPNDVLILCGDVHMGGFTDIFYDDGNTSDLVCRQICSSAIHNKESSLVGYVKVRTLLRFTEKYGNFSYNHYDWTRHCNFAILKINNSHQDLSYTVELIDEDGSELKNSKTPNWDSGIGSGCCSVL